MTRGGFDRMDVSTSVADDHKFRVLARRHPELYAPAFAGYVGGLLATCWREGERLTLEESWPPLLAWDPAAVAALVEVGLVDAETRIPELAFEKWYGSAAERRRLGRERQLRADQKRGHTRPVVSPGPPSSSDSQTDSTGSTDRPSVGTDASPAQVPTLAPTLAPRGEADPEGEPEAEAVTWLAQHGCYIKPGDGFHRHLVMAVERHGIAGVLEMFERLAAAGTVQGDIKGFVFKAKDLLDAQTRPNGSDVAKATREAEAERTSQRRIKATKDAIEALKATPEPTKTFAEMLPPSVLGDGR